MGELCIAGAGLARGYHNRPELTQDGYRIELGEVEHALAPYPGLQRPMVVARCTGAGEVSLVAYYLAEDSLPVSELREHLGSRLPAYMIPNAFIRLEAYPLLPNGKVNLKAMPELDATAHREQAEFQAPHTSLERELASLWQEILGRESVGVDQNFFALGGTSISLIQFHAKLERRYPGRISIAELPSDRAH